MLSRRAILAGTAVLAVGCGPLRSQFSAPMLPQGTELTLISRNFLGLADTRGSLRPRDKFQRAVAALAEDSENPHGEKRGKYGLTLRHAERNPEDSAAWLDDSGADLATVWPEEARALGEEGILLPLDQYLATDGSATEQGFYPSVLEQFRQGALYALPVDARPLVAYYDADYFSLNELPPMDSSWDWDDLVESARKLTRRGTEGRVTRWGLAAHTNQLWWALWQNEAEAVDAQTLQCRLQEPAAIAALQFVRDLLHTHRVSPLAFSMDLNKVSPPPAIVYGVPPIRPNYGDYRVAVLPRGKVRAVPVFADMGIAIAAQTEKPEAAYTALKGIVGALQPHVVVPAQREAVARLSELRVDLEPEEVEALEMTMDYGRAMPRNVPAIRAMRPVIEGLVRGEDVATVVNEACSIVRENQQA